MRPPKPYMTPQSLLDAIDNAIDEYECTENQLRFCVFYHVLDWLSGKVTVGLYQKMTLKQFWKYLKMGNDEEAENWQHEPHK